MQYRLIGLFVFSLIITMASSRLFHIAAKDILILSAVFAPLALLQKSLANLKREFTTTGSIFFNQHNWIFRWSSRLFCCFSN